MTQPHFSRTQLRRAVLSSYLGSVIEYYDFLLYATASAIVFNKIFFPSADVTSSTPSNAVRFAASSTGFTSTISMDSMRPESQIVSIAKCASR